MRGFFAPPARKQAAPNPVASGGGGTGTILLNDNFASASVGAVSLTARWTALGYTDVVHENGLTSAASTMEVLARGSVPAGLLANSNFPSGKTKVWHSNYLLNEDIDRMPWEGFPAHTQRTAWWAWWEYRPDNTQCGEKWLRIGNRVSGPGSGTNRFWDFIWCVGGSPNELTLISNSDGDTYPFGDKPFSAIDVSGLNHWEVGVGCSTGTNSDGWSQVYKNGTLIADVQSLRMWQDIPGSVRGIELFELGGWTSGNFHTGLHRYICQFKVSDSRIGVYAMDNA